MWYELHKGNVDKMIALNSKIWTILGPICFLDTLIFFFFYLPMPMFFLLSFWVDDKYDHDWYVQFLLKRLCVIKNLHTVRFTESNLLFCNGSCYFQDFLGFLLWRIFMFCLYNNQILFCFLNLHNDHLA